MSMIHGDDNGELDQGLDRAEVQESLDGGQDAPPEWQAPGWSKRWTQAGQGALTALRGVEGAAPHMDLIQKELDGFYKQYGQRESEYGHYRQRVDPIYNLVSKYEDQYRMQGMSLEQGLGQLFSVAEYLARNPDEAYAHIAGTNHPKDAAATIRALCQAWGVDPVTAFDNQQYQDPSIRQALNPLQQQLMQLTNRLNQADMQTRASQHQAVVQDLQQMESATDESGNPLYPHLMQVWDDMVGLIQHQRASDLPGAYKLAIRLNDDLLAETQKLEAEAARKKAIKDAETRTAQTMKVTRASRNIAGKGGGSGKPQNFSQVLREANRKLGA